MSRQSYAILGKVRELDAFLLSSPAWRERIHEVHPELSFSCWNSDRPMRFRKKSTEGFEERQRLVRGHFGSAYDRLLAALPSGRFGRDDLLDALAALWSAERAARGQALVVPADPEADERGLRMEILR